MSWQLSLVLTGLCFVFLLVVFCLAARARPRPGRLPKPAHDPRSTQHRDWSVK